MLNWIALMMLTYAIYILCGISVGILRQPLYELQDIVIGLTFLAMSVGVACFMFTHFSVTLA